MKLSLYEVGAAAGFTSLTDALSRWRQDAPVKAIIEITDSGAYAECISVALKKGQSLQLRAARRQRPVSRVAPAGASRDFLRCPTSHRRCFAGFPPLRSGHAPVIRWLDSRNPDVPGLSVSGEADSGFQLEGIIVTGRTVRIGGNLADVTIRHCTLVPGWGVQRNPALEVIGAPACITIDHSVIGAIQVARDPLEAAPLRLQIADSIVDAVSLDRAALGTPGRLCAHTDLTIRRSTIFGQLHTQSIQLAQDSLLLGAVYASRGQSGCVRFCYVAPESHTPRRHECQPDLVEKKVCDLYLAGDLTVAERNALIASERLRVEPEFDSTVYGTPTYCQLATTCAPEITAGAADECEMGACHAPYYPDIPTSMPPRCACLPWG